MKIKETIKEKFWEGVELFFMWFWGTLACFLGFLTAIMLLAGIYVLVTEIPPAKPDKCHFGCCNCTTNSVIIQTETICTE